MHALARWSAYAAAIKHNKSQPNKVVAPVDITEDEFEQIRIAGNDISGIFSLEDVANSIYRAKSLSLSEVALLDEIFKAKLKKRGYFTQDEATIIGASLRYLRTASQSSWDSLLKDVSLIGDTTLNTYFTSGSTKEVKLGDVNAENTIRAVKKLLNDNLGSYESLSISRAERMAFSKSNPTGLQEYNKHMQNLKAIASLYLQRLVRNSGKKVLPAQLVKAKMERDLEFTSLCELGPFKGYVDDTGALYTEDKNILGGKTPVSILNPQITILEINPDFDVELGPVRGNYYMKYSTPVNEQGKVSITTTGPAVFRQARIEKKFDTVNSLIDNIESARRKWMSHLAKSKPIAERIMGAMFETFYLVAPRVGSEAGMTAINGVPTKTYGLSTVLMKHVKDTGSSIIFSYKGKGGEPQKHKIDKAGSPLLYDLLQQLMVNPVGKSKTAEPKAPSEAFWGLGGAKPLYSGRDLNKAMKTFFGDSSATIHKFRHMRGSQIFNEIISKSPFKPKDVWKPKEKKEVYEWYAKQMEKVGKQLGHIKTTADGTKTPWETAATNYVDLAQQAAFFESLNLDPIPLVAKNLKGLRTRGK